MKIRWSVAARADLSRQRRYIEERNPRAAARIIQVILDAVSRLPEMPAQGRPGRISGTRELVIPRTPYVVPYLVDKSGVKVLRVLHGAQLFPDPVRRKK